MYMNNESLRAPSLQAVGTALRAVERQKQSLPMVLNADERAQRAALFHFLDASASEIFTLVANAAERGSRQVRVTDVPLLAQRLPTIFRSGEHHDFDADMFNDWLFSKDLSHHFYSDGSHLRW